jgi:hypothetical protein
MRKLVTSAALLLLAAMSVPKRSLLLLFATLLATPAHAETITVGYWDQNLGGGVTPLVGSSGSPIVLHNYLFGGFGGNATALIRGTNTYEFAIDDIFATTNDTARFYASFQGIVTAGSQITVPSVFWSQQAQPGFVIDEQIFVCGNVLFCDNYVVGGGTLLGEHTFNNALGMLTPTFNFTMGSPYTITEVFHVAADTSIVNGDVGGAILATPADPVAVPGPIAGAGLPGLVLASGGFLGWWRRRRNTACNITRP